MSIELNAKWPVQYYSLSSFFLLRIVFLTFRFIPLSPFIYFSPLPMIAPPRIPLLHLDGCNSICSARETYRAGAGITVPSCKKEKLLFRSNSKHSLSLSLPIWMTTSRRSIDVAGAQHVCFSPQKQPRNKKTNKPIQKKKKKQKLERLRRTHSV